LSNHTILPGLFFFTNQSSLTMKNFLLAIAFLAISNTVLAAEIIRIYSPYSPGHSGTPALRRVLDQANTDQSIYRFLLEFRPGGQQIIAVKSIDPENSLAVIAPAYVEHITSGKLDERNYVPVWALGDACWAVITNKPLTGQREFVVGGVGFGNAAHLTSLLLGQHYGFNVRYVVFKSNNDALLNMAGNNGVEFVIDKYEGFEALQTKNSKLRMVAASCPQRLPQAPTVKTLRELGIPAPYIFNIVIAHRDMPEARRRAVGAILNQATQTVGAQELFRLSAVRSPVLSGVSTEKFYQDSVENVKNLQKKFQSQIESASK
jgi:Tripartite tricarboxylate transporter family receptor